MSRFIRRRRANAQHLSVRPARSYLPEYRSLCLREEPPKSGVETMKVDAKDRVPLSQEALAWFKPNIANVHHVAYKCRDAEETRHFYEDILGLEFVAAIGCDRASPNLHLFCDEQRGNASRSSISAMCA
jgi:hypothetical protein